MLDEVEDSADEFVQLVNNVPIFCFLRVFLRFLFSGIFVQKGDTENMAMINNEAQLQQAIEQIQGLCHAIDSLRADIFPKNPKNFAIMAEGPVDEIRKLQADIDAYINRLEAMDTVA